MLATVAGGGMPATAAEPVAVAVVVPITVRAPGSGLLDATTLEVLTSPAGALTRELDAVLATSATIGLDPMIPASIRALGTAAPESAGEWLARLESAANEVFLLAYADADLSAFARVDALDLAAPLDLDFALDPAAFGPAATPTPTGSGSATATPTPTATPDGSPPPLPTTEELLAWDAAIGRIAWPAEGSVTSADVAAYAADGYDAVLLSSSNVSETASSGVDVGGIPGLVADSSASALLRAASASLDAASREDAIARLGVALDGLAAAQPGRSVVLTLDRGSTLSTVGLAATFAALESRASTRVVGMSEVLARVGGGASVVDDVAGADLAVADQLAAAVRAELRFATILAEPVRLTAPRRLELLALLAVQEVRQTGWDERAAGYLARSREIVGSVSIVDAGSVLVTSSSTFVPVSIANALEFPITVRVTATPRLPSIRVESPADVTVEPGSTATLRLEAQAITNGEVFVDVELSSPATGDPIGEPAAIEVDLQAQWETIGLVVGGVAALIFVGGIVRNVVVRRRKGTPAGAPETDDAE